MFDLRLLLAAVLLCVPLAACAKSEPAGPSLRAESKVFLPNLDDDAQRCAATEQVCNDSTDDVVNGPEDAKDLTRITVKPMPKAKSSGTIDVTQGAEHVRIFAKGSQGWQPLGSTVSAEQLRDGLTLGLEGRDIIRPTWDGVAKVRLSVHGDSSTVTLRSAAMRSTNHTMPARQLVLTEPSAMDPAGQAFVERLKTAMPGLGVPDGLRVLPGPPIPYPQDAFEQMWVARPTSGGRLQTMHLILMNGKAGAETAGIATLRGPNVGLVWTGPGVRTSYGNLETIPPYQHDGKSHPNGRIVIGVRSDDHPDMPPVRKLINLIRAQGADPLLIDVDFMSVGHVDEQIQFLPAKSARGWQLAVADPELGLSLLRQAKAAGQGGAKISSHPTSSEGTVDSFLTGAILADNQRVAAKVEANVAKIKEATGLTDAEIIRVPTLYRGLPTEQGRVIPALPDAVNNVVTTDTSLLIAQQWGVQVDGKDLFAEAVTAAYGKAGIKVTFIDEFEALHQGSGDVHCGTNMLRQLPVKS